MEGSAVEFMAHQNALRATFINIEADYTDGRICPPNSITQHHTSTAPPRQLHRPQHSPLHFE
jgi:hypothetical protein